jgi:hypothetical protein
MMWLIYHSHARSASDPAPRRSRMGHCQEAGGAEPTNPRFGIMALVELRPPPEPATGGNPLGVERGRYVWSVRLRSVAPLLKVSLQLVGISSPFSFPLRVARKARKARKGIPMLANGVAYARISIPYRAYRAYRASLSHSGTTPRPDGR